ncbi:DNA-directed RNA polymerase subunit alpha [Candidatus Parcubacteria bacterium]|nr:MAG: DNA-directed RNA polymerase subunit alpha [Candidatus Parcubacteria bacterium]
MLITLPNPPRLISQKNNEAVFEIENLYPGYGTTIGNALRRILLSSLRGAAISMVKIKGVSHEFSTIPHVLEDVVEIMLNLKQVRLRLFGGQSQKLSIKVKGEREVKAGDIQCPSQVEIMNPDLHIATLTDKKAEFEMELEVEEGIGYQTAEQRRKEKLTTGTIALDAIFTPVRKVNYEIENMRVGERTDYNLIRLTLETDGTISPEEALRQAVQILVDQFKELLVGIEAKVSSKPKKVEEENIKTTSAIPLAEPVAEAEKSEEPEGDSSQNVSSLNLSPRTFNALSRANIYNINDLVSRTERDVKALRGLGEKGLKEIKKELGKLGLTLRLTEE